MTFNQTKKTRKVTRENVKLEDMSLLGFDAAEAEFYLRIAQGELVESVVFVDTESASASRQNIALSVQPKQSRTKGAVRHALKP
jgi:hypothetical protein